MVKNTKGGSSHKKMARKNEDDHKELKIDLSINFKTDNLIILIDKNLGSCFTAEILYFLGDKKKYTSTVRVLHQRGKNSKKVFDRTQSRIALVSLVNDFKLEGGCIGYVEELLIIDHLNAYLAHGLIDKETFDLLNKKMNAKVDEKEDESKDAGFEFDRSNAATTTANAEYINTTSNTTSNVEVDINIDDI